MDTVYVKCGSHRAREKLRALVGDGYHPVMAWKGHRPVHGVEIPAEHLDRALAIKMVTQWAPKGRMAEPWTMR